MLSFGAALFDATPARWLALDRRQALSLKEELKLLYGSHPTIAGKRGSKMNRGIWAVLALACCLGVALHLPAQAPAGTDPAAAGQSKPAGSTQAPAPAKPAAKTSDNPFPEDTSKVPVLPSGSTPIVLDRSFGGSIPAPADDTDPVRSPDDSESGAATQEDRESSSSIRGLENLLPSADMDGKPGNKPPSHQETSSEDISVGGFYLEKGNWKAALSRFQSAMVLDPEDPEVYWGMAEAERHLGNFAEARTHYLKLLEYDPDGPHGKATKKIMKDPALASAHNPAQNHAPDSLK
jgi:tetratricopeptide (TPR) repeat protein